MFRILTIFLILNANLFATDKIQTVLVTIPVLHTSDNGGVKLARIPHTGWDVDNPYYSCDFYSMPIVVFNHEERFKQDINLISAYKLSVDSNHENGITHITVRTQDAKKPEGHMLTVEEVVELAIRALRADYPDEQKFLIKSSDKPFKPVVTERAGAGQRAANSVSGPEVDVKPQPELEGRSQ
jgi:hypothetical protein